MKKYWGICLCSLLAVSAALLFGCSKGEKGGAKEGRQEKTVLTWQIWNANRPGGKSFPEIWEEPLNEMLEEKNCPYEIKIEVYYDMSQDWDGEGEFTDPSEKLKKAAQQGVRADIVSIPCVSSGESADTGQIYYTYYPYREMAKAGLLEPLDSFLQSENGEKLREAVPDEQLRRMQIDGKTYGVSAYLREYHGTAYSVKYLKQFGIDPESLSGNVFENQEVFQKVQKESGGQVIPYWRAPFLNPGSRGYADESSTDFMSLSPDGVYINFYETEEWEEHVYRLKEWKEQELIVEDHSQNTPEFFAMADVAVGNQIYESSYSGYSSKSGDFKIETMVIPDLSDPILGLYGGESATAVASWSEQKKMAFDFLTLLYVDPDIANLIRYGVEGEDYRLKEGYACCEEDSLLHFWSSRFTNPLITWPAAGMPKDRYAMVEECYQRFEKNMPEGFYFDPAPVQEEIDRIHLLFGGTKNRESELYRQLCSGEAKDVSQALEEFREKLREAGAETVLTEANRQLEEWRNEQ